MSLTTLRIASFIDAYDARLGGHENAPLRIELDGGVGRRRAVARVPACFRGRGACCVSATAVKVLDCEVSYGRCGRRYKPPFPPTERPGLIRRLVRSTGTLTPHLPPSSIAATDSSPVPVLQARCSL